MVLPKQRKRGHDATSPCHGIRKDQLKQEPSQAAGSQARAGGKKKSHKTVTMARLGLPAREDTLPVHRPEHLVVAGQQRRKFWRKGSFALTFSQCWQPQHSLPHALHVPCLAGEQGLRRRRPAVAEAELNALLWHDPALLWQDPACPGPL